jgi:cytochrome P450
MHVSQYVCYNSYTNFFNPREFVPERWLGDPEYVDDNRDALQPFSYGPWGCLGKR